MKKLIIFLIIILFFSSKYLTGQTLPVISCKFGNAHAYTIGDSLFVNTGEVERKWVWTGKGLVTQYVKNMATGQAYSNSQKLIRCDWNLQNAGIEKDKKEAEQNLTGCDWNWIKPDASPA